MTMNHSGRKLRRIGIFGLIGVALAVWASVARAHPPALVFSSIDFPGAVATRAFGINTRGAIVGSLYLDLSSRSHSFLWDKRGPREIIVPGATSSSARGINARGEIVGVYTDAANRTHGYLLSRTEEEEDDDDKNR